MWNIKDINDKKRYFISMLRNESLSVEDREKLQLSLFSCYQMLDSSGTIMYTTFPKLFDIISDGSYTTKKENSYSKIVENIDLSGSISYNDRRFLVELALCIANEETNYQVLEFKKLDIDDSKLLSFAHDFYKQLGDIEIYNIVINLLARQRYFNFTKNMGYKKEYLGGTMYWDYVFNNAYLNIYRHDTICDINSIIHEIMHAIDFSFMPKIKTRYNSGTIEIPTFTTDFLVIDYLEHMNFDINELNKLKKQKYLNVQFIADQILNLLKRRCSEIGKNSNVDFVMELLTPEINLLLIKLKTAIVSYGLYLQIKCDRNKGINNLKKYMQMGILKNQSLDFSFIELSDQKLMEMANIFREEVNSLESSLDKVSL